MRSIHRTSAFTLVELLVVIGIIAVLISILLPSLARARQAAQSVACLSNLRQIGQGLAMYVNDNQGILPPARVRYVEHGWGAVSETWASLLIRGGYLPDAEYNWGANGTTRSIFACPESNTETGWFDAGWDWGFDDMLFANKWSAASWVSGKAHDLGYGINATDQWWGEYQLPFVIADDPAAYPRPVKITMIKNPTNMAMIYDGYYMRVNQPRNINARHRDRTQVNILLADGHCEGYSTKTIIDPDRVHYIHDGYWTGKTSEPNFRLDQP